MAVAFVTGGNGFIGSHLIESLLADGHTVRALVRDPVRTRWLPPATSEVLPGDLHHRDVLSQGIRGADVVYHLAALTRADTESEMRRVNLEGTRNVIEACLEPQVPPRLAFLSSQAAGGPSSDGRPVTESSPPAPRSWYGTSKLDAEKLVHGVSDRLSVVVLRPPSVYGPRDDAFLPLFRAAKRGLLILPRGARSLSVVHVDDLVRGARLAAETGRGTYYLTDGRNRPLPEILSAIAAAVKRSPRLVPVPQNVFVAGVWLTERLARWSGRRPPMTTDRAHDAVATDWICSDARAREELGYRSEVDLGEGMAATARWYGEAGWL
jgi:nucleoside-diphosphate-sugar epimerase